MFSDYVTESMYYRWPRGAMFSDYTVHYREHAQMTRLCLGRPDPGL